MTFVGLGVGVDSLLRVSASADGVPKEERWKQHMPATALVGTGGVLLSYATWRYYRVQRCLQGGTFPINKVGVASVVATTSVLTLGTLILTISDDIIDTSTWAPVQPIPTSASGARGPPPPPPPPKSG